MARRYERGTFRALDQAGNPVPGAQISFWDDQAAGAQATGLLELDGTTPIPGSIIAADTWGYLSKGFIDPNDHAALYAIGSPTGSIPGVQRVYLAPADTPQRVTALETAIGAPTIGLADRIEALEEGVDGSVDLIGDLLQNVWNVRDFGAQGDGVTNDAPAVQNALNAARDAGGGWVIVPKGTYRLATLPLRIYRNTRLTLLGATMVRAVADTMLLNGDADQTLGGYTGHGSLVIEGGTWDMKGTTVTAYDVCMSIGHAENVTIQNVTIKDTPGYHAIEINSTKTCRIRDSRFVGLVESGDRAFTEAIQPDLAKGSPYFGGFGPYDHTPCEDFTVEGCYFGASGTPGSTAWHRGIGSHSATVGRWHRRMKILNCTFEGLSQWAISGYNWEEVVAQGNQIRDCGGGIWLRVLDSGDTNDTLDTTGAQTSASQAIRDLVVADNVVRGLNGYARAIHLQGETSGKINGAAITGNITDGDSGAGNAIRVEHVNQYTISGNECTDSGGTAISQEQITGGVVSGNRIYSPGSSGISCDTGTGIQIASNSVRDAALNGYHVLGGSDVQLIGNYSKSASRDTNLAGYGIRVSTGTAGMLITGNKIRRNGSGNEAAYGLSITNTCTGIRRYGNDLTDSGSTGNLDDQSVAPSASPWDENRFILKTANETVTSSTTLQDDNHLATPVAAGGVYEVEFVLAVTGADGPSAGGIKTAWAVPAGSTGLKHCLGPAVSISGASGSNDGNMYSSARSFGTSTAYGTATNAVSIRERAIITIGATAGEIRLQWAQQASNATGTVVQGSDPGRSYMKITRIG